MRKFLFMAATAALMLSSCSEDKEVGKSEENGGEIAFRSFIDKGSDTRATVTTESNILGFTVTGWWDKTDDGSAVITSPETNAGYLFNAFDITRREAGIGNWEYSPSLYWPKKGLVHFFAYSPASSIYVTQNKGLYEYAGQALEYTMPEPGREVSQEDFLLARTAPMNGGTVQLNFAHVLSRATFSAKKTNPGITYLIKSVELMNINKKGTIDLKDIPENGTFSYAQTASEPIVTLWSSNTKGDLGIDLGNSPVYVENDYKSILGTTNALMVMPQKTSYATNPSKTSTDFMIKVLYKAFIEVDDPGTYYAGSMGTDDDTYKTVYFPVHDDLRSITSSKEPFTFEIGRQYNFSLSFGAEAGGEIAFNVEVGKWDDEIDINLPLKNYWFEGLISESIAKAINSDYREYGVTQVQLDNCTSLTMDATTDADLKGLEYLTKTTELRLNMMSSTSKLTMLDTKVLPNLKKLTFGEQNDATIETVDISGGSLTQIHAGTYKDGTTYRNGSMKIGTLIVPNGLTLTQWKNSMTFTQSSGYGFSTIKVGEIMSGSSSLGKNVTLP
ncbi:MULTISPECIES: fimbrillin family protein [unclassified Parabacteroides]|uniref:fimbrillin family protein n=1 Tax=unclassified Parabacteroides TaxID=2649774 RepID=UPI002473CBEB|nr:MULTISPECIES: fimbrillin family protein [unclassified Parabacteroides]